MRGATSSDIFSPAGEGRKPPGVLDRAGEAFSALRNIWRPENFHYHHLLHKPSNRFEGWYFKVTDAEERQPYAIIAACSWGRIVMPSCKCSTAR